MKKDAKLAWTDETKAEIAAAKFYYVDGKWGEAKKIALPRNMVIWDK